MTYKRAFFNLDQARAYLNESIIRVNDLPVYISDVYSKNFRKFLLYFIVDKGRRNGEINLNDPKVNMAPVPLGYTNFKGDSFLLSRFPSRQWKVGLSRYNCSIRDMSGKQRRRNYFSAFLDSANLFDTITGVYPTLQEAISIIEKKNANNVAFNRKLAINSSGQVIFSLLEDAVGEIKDNKIDFYPDFEYLRRKLGDVE